MNHQISILVDTREQIPLTFTLPTIRTTLQTGDYSIQGAEDLFAVERKSLADLTSCCAGNNRLRFERELHRLRGYRFKRLLIIGTEKDIKNANYRSGISPASVLGSLSAWEARFDIPVVYSPNPDVAAFMVERWANYFAREVLKCAEILNKQVPQLPIAPKAELSPK